MVYRKTNRALSEEVDSLEIKMKTLEDINEDLQSKINEMLKENQRMNKIPPNFNFKCDSCEFKCAEWDDMNKHKADEHKEVQTVKKCKICSKTFLQNHE